MILPPSTETSQHSVVVDTVHNNTSLELISITADKLKLILIEHLKCVENKKAWQNPLSILLTIILVFCSAEFKPAFGIPASTWQAVFIIAGIGSTIWLGTTLFSIRKNTLSLDDVLSIIKNRT